MKNLIKLTIPVAFSLSAILTTPSCTKNENIVYVKDTVLIITHDTTKIITHDTLVLDQDSVRANFAYTITYPTDSIGQVAVDAQSSSTNVPSNALYTWRFDGNLYVFSNQTYVNQGFNFAENGQHSLSLTITCPSTGKTYSVVKTFTIALKG